MYMYVTWAHIICIAIKLYCVKEPNLYLSKLIFKKTASARSCKLNSLKRDLIEIRQGEGSNLILVREYFVESSEFTMKTLGWQEAVAECFCGRLHACHFV